MTRYCLDSWAVLRWLEGSEPAASRVDAVLADRPVMSWINAGEVYYVTMRLAGESVAREVVGDLHRLLDLEEPSRERVLQAASIKASHPMAFADAFAIATAIAHDAVVLTGDPEILMADAPWPAEDLRSPH